MFRIKKITANYIAVWGELILADATVGDIVVTLPAPSFGLRSIQVKKTDSELNTVTVVRSGSALIDGETSVVLSDQYEATQVTPDGTNWQVTGAVGGTASSATEPDAPTISTAVPEDGAATLNWTAPASNGGAAITAYEWELVTDVGETLVDTNTVGVVLTSGPIASANGTAVKGRVRAINSAGAGAWSAYSNTVTPSDTFSPVSIGTLVRWGDPQSLSAGAVASYPDSSLVGTTLTQGTGSKQPTCIDAVLDGQKVVRFDGTDDFLVSANFGSPLTQPNTAVLVFKTNSTPTNVKKLIDGGGPGRNAAYIDVSGTSGNWDALNMYAGGSGAVAGAGTIPIGSWNILIVEFNGSSSRFWVNGGTAVDWSSDTDETGPQGRITLACDAGQGAHFVHGDYGPDFFFNGLLSSGVKNQLGAWLLDKYPSLTWVNV